MAVPMYIYKIVIMDSSVVLQSAQFFQGEDVHDVIVLRYNNYSYSQKGF